MKDRVQFRSLSSNNINEVGTISKNAVERGTIKIATNEVIAILKMISNTSENLFICIPF